MVAGGAAVAPQKHAGLLGTGVIAKPAAENTRSPEKALDAVPRVREDSPNRGGRWGDCQQGFAFVSALGALRTRRGTSGHRLQMTGHANRQRR